MTAAPRATRSSHNGPTAVTALRSAVLTTCLFTGATLALPVLAQTGTPTPVQTEVSITGLGTFKTNLSNSGGSFNWGGGIVAASLGTQVNPQWNVGFNISYGVESWSFSSPTAFGGQSPWGTINRPSVGFNVGYAVQPDLRVFVAPAFQWDYETNASMSAQNFGAVVGVSKAFSRDQVIGLGLGVFHQIDANRYFPFLIVNWKLDDKWKIANPFRAGPTGGAGLEAVYTVDDDWEFAAGGTYRQYRFRLREDGPNANGIGQNQGIPLFARLSRKMGKDAQFDVYAGATVGGALKLYDPNGNLLVKSDYSVAPFLAATFSANF